MEREKLVKCFPEKLDLTWSNLNAIKKLFSVITIEPKKKLVDKIDNVKYSRLKLSSNRSYWKYSIQWMYLTYFFWEWQITAPELTNVEATL